MSIKDASTSHLTGGSTFLFLLAGVAVAFLAAVGAECAAVPGVRDVICDPEAIDLDADPAVGCVSASTAPLGGIPDFYDANSRCSARGDAQSVDRERAGPLTSRTAYDES